MARKWHEDGTKVWEGLQMINALQDGLQIGFENGIQVSVGNGLLEVSEPAVQKGGIGTVGSNKVTKAECLAGDEG